MINFLKRYLLQIISLIVLLVLSLFNLSSATFWNTSFTEVITIGLAIFVSFYLTENLNDKRRRNDCIEHIILEIESMMNEDFIFSLNKDTLIHQSSCANRIKYLKDANFRDIQADIDFIAREFEEIRDLHSNHKQTSKKLKTVLIDFEKHRALICDKCNKIRIGLYVH